MNKPYEPGVSDTGVTEIRDQKKRYSAGVLKYRQMCYWNGEIGRAHV